MPHKLKPELKEPLSFLAASFLFFAGLFLLYWSGISLQYLVEIQYGLPKAVFLAEPGANIISEIIPFLEPVFAAIFALIICSFALTLVSVSPPGRLKYGLIFPIIISGFLFGFSKPYLFFGLGLFLGSLYSIALGEAYREEIKKWREFRVGSSASSKALLVAFALVFVGVYVAMASDSAYSADFEVGLRDSMAFFVAGEIGGMSESESMAELKGEMVSDAMQKIREEYPGLSESQYAEMEDEVAKRVDEQFEDAQSKQQYLSDDFISSLLESSPIFNALISIFPILMAITVWAGLEFLRMFVLSPFAGLFSVLCFRLSSGLFENNSALGKDGAASPNPDSIEAVMEDVYGKGRA
jgi:hypothetical protein